MLKFLLAVLTLTVSFSAVAATDVVASTVCSVETPAYKVKATFEAHKVPGQGSVPAAIQHTSNLAIDGKDIPAVQKYCIKQRCPHRHGQEVIELYPRFDKNTNVVTKAELLLWYGPSVNRISLNCPPKK